MKRATISEIKNKLSQYLGYVKAGETVVVLDRNRPIAQIQPVHKELRSADDHLSQLEARGTIRRGDSRLKRHLKWPSQRAQPSGVLAALLAERSEER